ncbi:hypothetical protein [Ancylobacter sp. FA202]|uniref:hypothetical protein n=1 Tax=Ancylobacter sp. FA202 TaxID=1111106 RepID=UPI0012DE0DA0|nr:hypothetical protein [Ancylobacter sp. FA202]
MSLFDFAAFDAVDYDKRYAFSSWHEFVPYRKSWRGAVWIEINRDIISDRFVSAAGVVKFWKNGPARHKIMPMIEAAHIGRMETTAFRSVFFTWAKGAQQRDIAFPAFNKHQFDAMMQEWRAYLDENPSD